MPATIQSCSSTQAGIAAIARQFTPNQTVSNCSLLAVAECTQSRRRHPLFACAKKVSIGSSFAVATCKREHTQVKLFPLANTLILLASSSAVQLGHHLPTGALVHKSLVMRTKQSAEFEKQESTWIYLLHQQAPPHTRLSAEASLALPPLDTASSNDFSEQATTPAPLLLPPPPSAPSTMMLSSQDKAWQPPNSLLTLSLPRLSDLGNSTPGGTKSPHHSNKRACFPKKCDFPMCKNSSRSRGFCYSHGGGRRCRVDGCNNGAVSRDLCKRHGGGRRCRVAGCKSSSESGGLCYSHGGGRRCSLSWCSARAKKGGFCAVHLTGDRTPPADVTDTSVAISTSENVVETLLSLAKNQSSVKVESTMETSPTAGKSAYAIASLLN